MGVSCEEFEGKLGEELALNTFGPNGLVTEDSVFIYFFMISSTANSLHLQST